MNLESLGRANSHIGGMPSPEVRQGALTARAVLEELFQLLEDYAPTWYTEEHHKRAVAALLRREGNGTPDEFRGDRRDV